MAERNQYFNDHNDDFSTMEDAEISAKEGILEAIKELFEGNFERRIARMEQ